MSPTRNADKATDNAAEKQPASSPRTAPILTAASALLRRGGADALNMRALAEAAGVSIATPYNIFGSKEGVLLAVMDADLVAHQARLERLPKAPLAALFAACERTIDYLTEDPDYYRALLIAIQQAGSGHFRLLVNGPRYLQWKSLLQNARHSGDLSEAIHPDALAITVCQQLATPINEWTQGDLSAEELKARTHFGLALVLLGAATPSAQTALAAELQQAQTALATLWQSLLHKRLEGGPLSAEESALFADQLKEMPRPKPLEVSQ